MNSSKAKRILFSPVGNTDPVLIKKDKDGLLKERSEGSLIQICRKYKPDLIYLYMSKEILEHHKKDNRYILALDELYKFLGKEYECKIIERGDLVDVHLFDVFYEDFRNELNKIYNESGEGDEIYLNISSGTPAMKSTLFVLSNFLHFKTMPVQVSTPSKKSNTDVGDYDVELCQTTIQEENKKENSDTRTEIPKIENINFVLKKEIIKNHIEEYNYPAALSVADTIRDFLSDRSYYLIKTARERFLLRRQSMIDASKKTEGEYIPYLGEFLEYLLYLEVLIRRDLVLEFVRGMSPAFFDLLEILFEKVFNIKLKTYTSLDKNGVTKWDEEKIKKNDTLYNALNNIYNNGFDFKGFLKTDHLVGLLENEDMLEKYKVTAADIKMIDMAKKLRKIESDARNKAAHTIVCMTDDNLKKITGFTSQETFDIMKKLTSQLGLNITKNNWDSYNIMNELINKSLGED